jgi:hypothetical protein
VNYGTSWMNNRLQNINNYLYVYVMIIINYY